MHIMNSFHSNHLSTCKLHLIVGWIKYIPVNPIEMLEKQWKQFSRCFFNVKLMLAKGLINGYSFKISEFIMQDKKSHCLF